VRLLVVDENRVLPWVVERLVPPGVRVEIARGYEAAARVIRTDPPAAVVVSLPPAWLPWRDFQKLCASRQPPIPVLYESCLIGNAAELGLDPADGYAEFLEKPAPRARLQAALHALVARARAAAKPVGSAPQPADL